MNNKLQKIRVHLETIQLNAAGQRGVKPGMWDYCHAAATKALDTLEEVDKVDTIQAQSRCVCNSKKPHFCPPCFGDEGFFACDPEDIAANVIELADANTVLREQRGELAAALWDAPDNVETHLSETDYADWEFCEKWREKIKRIEEEK